MIWLVLSDVAGPGLNERAGFGHDESRPDVVAGNVGNDQVEGLVAAGQEIEVIAPHLAGWNAGPAREIPWVSGVQRRQQSELDVFGDLQLPFLLPGFDQAVGLSGSYARRRRPGRRGS